MEIGGRKLNKSWIPVIIHLGREFSVKVNLFGMKLFP
jgi:hypothetical protein